MGVRGGRGVAGTGYLPDGNRRRPVAPRPAGNYGTVYTLDPSRPEGERIPREQRAVTGKDTPSRHGRTVTVVGDWLLVGSNGNNPSLAWIDADTGEVSRVTFPAPGLGNIQAIAGDPAGREAYLLTANGWWVAIDMKTAAVQRRQHVLPSGRAGDLAMREGVLHAASSKIISVSLNSRTDAES